MENAVLTLGVIFLILGYIFAIPILWTIGIILAVIGAVLWIATPADPRGAGAGTSEGGNP
jgi:hypothetical protein